MIKVVIAAAAFGFSAAMAHACPAHDAHAGVDEKMTVASVETEKAPMTTVELAPAEEPLVE